MFERTLGTRGAIDRRELAFKAMAGLIGGAIGWIPVELASHGHRLTQAQSGWTEAANFLAMMIVAGTIGGMILASSDNTIEFTPAARRRFFRGFIFCVLLAVPGNFIADLIFTNILIAGGFGTGNVSLIYLFIGRIISWTVLGFVVGVGVGLATLSLRNVVKGAIGGWVGGFVGGAAFDPISALSQTGLFSRLIGFSLIGLAIGFFIGLVQELTKMAWLAVEAGRLKGRQFRLESSTVMIGRAEENPVGLFGDPGVQPRHAVIEQRGDGYMLKNLAVQQGTYVNGDRIETTPLREGDRIRISNYEMTFHARATHAAQPAAQGWAPPPHPVALEIPPRTIAEPPRAEHASDGPYLAGANGDRFAIKAGANTQIGRALDNDIVISHASVSRHHALIEARNGAYVVRDLGSQNGTWVGSERVGAEAAVTHGDPVKFGDAVFIFHA
jgi:pSer/pThr/pTyr-binding forkhead associated (FHA) protein